MESARELNTRIDGVVADRTWTEQGAEARGSLGGEVRVRFTFR